MILKNLRVITNLHPNIAEMIRANNGPVKKLAFPEAFFRMGTTHSRMNENFTGRFEKVVSNLWIGIKLEL